MKEVEREGGKHNSVGVYPILSLFSFSQARAHKERERRPENAAFNASSATGGKDNRTKLWADSTQESSRLLPSHESVKARGGGERL